MVGSELNQLLSNPYPLTPLASLSSHARAPRLIALSPLILSSPPPLALPFPLLVFVTHTDKFTKSIPSVSNTRNVCISEQDLTKDNN